MNKVLTKTGDYEASCFRSPQAANADALYNSLYTDGSTNVMFYSNPEVDASLDSIRATTDPEAQIAALEVIQNEIAVDLPTVPLLFDLFGNIYSNRVSGLPIPEPWSLGAIKFATL